MEVEREWVATIEEEKGSGLEIRQRRRGKMGNPTFMEKEEVVEEEERVTEEVSSGMEVICRHRITTVMEKEEVMETGDQMSVYLASNQDIEFNDITAGLKLREDQVAEEKNPNGKVYVRTEVNYLGNILVEEEDNVATEKLSNWNIPIGEEHQYLKNGVVESGLTSQLSYESGLNSQLSYESGLNSQLSYENGNGIIQHEDEIEESEQFRPGKSHKLEDKEFDVERVLEEQETHDLYCPNCNSCITKRVILRKRKRIAPESQHELPPEKLPHVVEGGAAETTEVGHVVEGGAAETTEVGHEDETVFRCLSCFSIFIPRDGGFNIFRFFGRREEKTNLQSSEQVPVRNTIWPSIFRSGGTRKEGTEEGLPLPCESTVIPGMQTADSPLNPQTPPTITLSGAGELGSIGDYTNKPGVMIEPSLPGEIFQTNQNVSDLVPPSTIVKPLGNDFIKRIGKVIIPKLQIETGQPSQNIHDSEPHAAAETLIDVGSESVLEPRRNSDWDVLKSIVYGGLIESITSLGVVSSAAGTDTSTLNICALGLANLVGGLLVIVHALSELRSNAKPEATDLREKPADRYWELLGRRDNFRRHFVVSILSYIVFGLLPPVIYGFSFRKSDNKEYKLIAVAIASLFSIALLGIGKAHVKPQKDYIKSLSYYIMLGVSASGLSYVAGVLIDKLLVEIGVFDPSASPSSSIDFRGIGSGVSAWTSS